MSAHSQVRYLATDMGSLGGTTGTYGYAINQAGTVVGGSGIPGGNAKAFVFENGTISEIVVPQLAGYVNAFGINDAGVICGDGYVNAFTYSQPYESFLYDHGTITMLATSGGTTSAQGINNSNIVVGGFALDYSNYNWNAFLATNGVVTALGTIDSAWVSYGFAINDAGTAVGYYSNPNSNQGGHAFIYTNGVMSGLGTLPGGTSSTANAINRVGTIVGYSTTASGNQHAMMYTNGGMVDLGTLGGTSSIANGINNPGMVVGGSSTANPADGDRAFLYASGQMVDLNTTLLSAVPTVLTNATAINDLGLIVANGANQHAYLLSPVPANVPNSPAITNQPASITVAAHGSATFSVSATGVQPLSYQWKLNGTNLAGATSSSLVLPNAVQTNLGNYSVTITNSYGSVTSSVATLSMPPFIASPFPGAVKFWGQNVSLALGAWGSAPLAYQWYNNGTAIAGATGATLGYPSIQFTNAGTYTVVVTNAFGNATNSPVQVVVNPANVTLAFCPTLTITGTVGYSFSIYRTANLGGTNPWSLVAQLTLTSSPQTWVDTSADASSPFHPAFYYKIVPGQ